MPTETLSKNGRVGTEPGHSIFAERGEDNALRERALTKLERVRGFKIHAIVYAAGIPVLGLIWMLSGYFQDSTWPSRFADSGGPDTWNPWFFWAAGVWTAVLVFHGVRAYVIPRFARPPTKVDIDREVDRIKSRS